MSENNVLRKCSRCHTTKLEEYFAINAKGELFKTCENCRVKKQQFRDKPLDEQYSICEKCGGRFHKVFEGKSRHLKRWPCIKSQMEGNPGKKEFFEWVLENRNNLIRDYQKYISKAEEYLSSQ